MLLTIATTHQPATDLGYLLHKNPAKIHSFELSFGQVYVFYPEASPERCAATVLLDVDPVGMVRGKHGAPGTIDQYVNDRPYVASSFLSVAIAQVFGSALTGKSRERPELVETPIPLVARLVVVPCHGGERLLHQLFAPLGYTVQAERHILDPLFPQWGESRYYTLTLTATCTVRELLTHLYVLVPVLDNEKHYWVGDDEVEKLLRHGAGWLAEHPFRELIATRYLRRQRSLVEAALAQLVGEEHHRTEEPTGEKDTLDEKGVNLHQQRLQAVLAAIKESGAKRVLDLGCGEGKLLKLLLADGAFEQILGLDVSYQALGYAQQRLHLDRLSEQARQRITLIHGSLTYRDKRLAGYDAAAVVEVIEHLDPQRLAAFENVLFGCARPGMAAITTPNAEYNALYTGLTPGALRHRDHRFEWTRAEFENWASGVASRYGYQTRFLPVGPEDSTVGAPSQMAICTRVQA